MGWTFNLHPVAIIPACRIPPPSAFLTRCAFFIVSASEHKSEPTGAPRPFEVQIETESAKAHSSFIETERENIRVPH